MPSLFEPIQLGAIHAPNRIVMAPLTRARNTRDHVATPLMVEYYRQRASAGLIISEATGISQQGLGWPFGPGIWREDQVAAWKKVTDAVHDANGRMVSQLWHMGRLVHPSLPGRGQPVSSSATTAPGLAHTYDGKQPYVQAHALSVEEIAGIVEDYRHAAKNALAAGFDGVEIHAANGYLIDQFLRDNSNLRTDGYGGAPENRIRFLVEVTRAVASVVGADRVGVRMSPNGESQGVIDSNPEVVFSAAAAALAEIGVAFIELREPRADGTRGKPQGPPVAPAMRRAFRGPMILNSDYDGASAQAALDHDEADAISFGRLFIANPDLPRRLAERLPLAHDDASTHYTQGAEGYVDYPTAAQEQSRR